jgi:hypothetical protein
MSTTPADLIRDLADADVHVDDLWELVNTRSNYAPAIPVLTDWLRSVDARVPAADRPKVREGLVRALSVRAAKPSAALTLIEEFRRADDPSGLGIRWVIGNALSVVADDSVFEQIAALVQDRGYGKARQMLVPGLARSADPRAVPLLVGLLDDDDVVAHAVAALGVLKLPGVRAALEPLLDHHQALVRREAKKALARLPG